MIHRSSRAAFSLLAGLSLLWTAPHLHAQDAPPVDRVAKLSGEMWKFQDGRKTLMEDEIKFPHNILVKTNGTFTVSSGKERELAEGQILRADGRLLSPDGSIVPVYDHIVMKAGQPRLYKDGTSQPLQTAVTLKDGTRIQPDGYVVQPDGRRLRLLDGQLFRLDGGKIPVKDTITVNQGTVTVQKDGSLLKVPPGRSLIMNDGTKVFGDGTVIMMDGSRKKLAEGQVIVLPGVTVDR